MIKKLYHHPDFQNLKYILTVFLVWKLILTLLTYFGLSVLPVSLPHSQFSWANADTGYWVRWANWDGGHFRGIAENGYLSFQVVFFPLYALLIKSLMLIKIPSLWGGLIISNVSLVGALLFLYKLVCLDTNEKVARKVIILTLAFPTAFYFNAVYSESLFLLLSVSAFYFARTDKWITALLLAALATVTRLTGLVVILAVSLEYFLTTDRLPGIREYWSEFLNRIASYLIITAFSLGVLQWVLIDSGFYMFAGISRTIVIFLVLMASLLLTFFVIKFLLKHLYLKRIFTAPTIFLLFSFAPFLAYCFFLYYSQDNFLAFIAHEKQWERHLTLPWTAPINYLRIIINSGFSISGKNGQSLIELLFFIFFFVMLTFSYLKLRLSYTVYFALSLIIPLSTGTLEAIHRYGLVIFPVFLILAMIKNDTYAQLWMYFSLTMLGLLSVMFINAYWVS